MLPPALVRLGFTMRFGVSHSELLADGELMGTKGGKSIGLYQGDSASRFTKMAIVPESEQEDIDRNTPSKTDAEILCGCRKRCCDRNHPAS